MAEPASGLLPFTPATAALLPMDPRLLPVPTEAVPVLVPDVGETVDRSMIRPFLKP